MIGRLDFAHLAQIAFTWLRKGLIFAVFLAPLNLFVAATTHANVRRGEDFFCLLTFGIMLEGI